MINIKLIVLNFEYTKQLFSAPSAMEFNMINSITSITMAL